MKQKIVAMMAALAAALCASAEMVQYYDPTDPANPDKEADCTLVTSSTTILTHGWYAVKADVTIMGRVTVNKNGVNLILCDGATLNATNGVRLTGSNSLTIYGQRQGTGALFALRPNRYNAGIGGDNGEKGGTLTVNGGWMKVWGGEYGAAIGGGCAADGGKLVVNGGEIIAEGYEGSAAIGGGDDGSGGEVEINGGHITAIGSSRSSTRQAAAGIGAGRPHPESDHSRTSGTVKINGGTVIAVAGTAQGSDKAAQAIGVNLDDKGKDTGTLTLGRVMVFSPTNAVTPCAATNRTAACRQTGSVRIESCTHDYGGDTCSWCGTQISTVSYLDPTDPENPERLCTDFTFITNQTALTSGWYVVAGAVTSDSRIYVSGDVNLILTDGAELTANGGVTVDWENRLTIWAQSTNAVAGRLLARCSNFQAGIGGVDSSPGGMVTINGGTVEAHGGFSGAGIGGGRAGAGGMVTINGGEVTAYGGVNGAGIGGGASCAGGEVTVNGGTVKAEGGWDGAGIGGGNWGWRGGIVTVNDGTVEARGRGQGAGIGGGHLGEGGTVRVNGGEVTVQGANGGAAIGAGVNATNDGSLSIDGMKVGYVESDGKVHEWAAPDERDGCCRNRASKTVRIEVCIPHACEGGICTTCGMKFSYLDPTDPENPEKFCTDFTFITKQTVLTSGWYVVAGAITNASRITVSGDVNIILMDYAELAANSGVNVEGENNLTIWAQSTNAIAGKLTARGGTYQAGIGGVAHSPGGTVTVNGGMVEAHGGWQSAGIGGGWEGAGGEVTVNGGTVEAHGGEYGAGIGGGRSRAGGTVTVNGGMVEAHGGWRGAGIGAGGWGWRGGEVTVNGGTVVAHGGDSGVAAIGGGYNTFDDGSLSIVGMAVYDADTSETPVAFCEREAVCRSSWAKITPCPYADEAHGLCPYCGFSSLVAGEYFKATLAEMGYEVPTDGTAYNVKAYGLPAGLKLMSNKAVTKKVKVKGKWKKVVVKPAKTEWWIEGVPTAALDYETNPPYLAITANGKTEVVPVYLEVFSQNVTELGTFPIGNVWDAQNPLYLPGVTSSVWKVSGLPSGLKYTSKLVTTKKMKGKKVLSVTTNALPFSVYGKVAKAGLFTITAKKKNGAFYETMKYRVLVTPKPVDTAIFGELPTNITTMAYVPVAWDLAEGGSGRLGEAALPGEAPLPVVPTVATVTGLPGGVVFASANTYYDKKKTKLKQAAQTIVGTPTKPGTYVVTFTRNVKEKVKGKTKTVAKTAQILWVVEPNDVEVKLGFNTSGGVIESGMVGLKYGDLLAFSATSNATVTASGLPAGIKLVKLDEGGGSGRLGEAALPGEATYAFTGFTAKAGTYLVTVTAKLNDKTVTQRVALKVDGLPAWAKGTFNGYVWGTGNGEGGTGGTNGLATITVSAAGKISGKFSEGGTNWTLSAASYTARSAIAPYQDAFLCSAVVARYAYKAKEKVKGKWKTVTKYVTRTFTLTVGEDAFGGVATLKETGGSTVATWQNLWGSTYKAVGKKLFYTSKKKQYKTFTVDVYTNAVGAVTFIQKGDDVDKTGLTYFINLSLKITTAGAVTATLTYDTGKKKKGKAVIYKPTCSTVVIPTSAADADPFTGEVPLYFASSPANNFPGFATPAPL